MYLLSFPHIWSLILRDSFLLKHFYLWRCSEHLRWGSKLFKVIQYFWQFLFCLVLLIKPYHHIIRIYLLKISFHNKITLIALCFGLNTQLWPPSSMMHLNLNFECRHKPQIPGLEFWWHTMLEPGMSCWQASWDARHALLRGNRASDDFTVSGSDDAGL